MRCFKNIAALIRQKRLQHPKAYSQSELSHMLGYKNGQFISNVERALCNIPLKMLVKVSDVLDIQSQEIKEAILKDHEETLNNYLNLNVEKNTKGSVASLNSSENEGTTSGPDFQTTARAASFNS